MNEFRPYATMKLEKMNQKWAPKRAKRAEEAKKDKI